MKLNKSSSVTAKKVNTNAYIKQRVVIAVVLALLSITGAKFYSDHKLSNGVDFNKIDKVFD